MAVLVDSLTTRDSAKLEAGITVSTFDANIERLVNRISTVVRRYIGHQLTRGTYSEVLPNPSRQLLLLKEFPIISITTLTDRGVTLVSDSDYRCDQQDKARGVVYRENGWQPTNIVSGLTLDIQAAVRDINITYVAGYYMPNDTGAGHYVEGSATSLPDDIQQVVDEMIAARWIRIKTGTQGVTSYREADIALNFQIHRDTEEMGISDEHAEILNKYKGGGVA